MTYKRFIPNIYIKDGKGFADAECSILCYGDGDVVKTAMRFESDGADGVIIIDLSTDDISHEKNIGLLRRITSVIDIPVTAGGAIKRLEDVKKYLYAGAKRVIIERNIIDVFNGTDVAVTSAERFGSDKIVSISKDGSFLFRTEDPDGLILIINDKNNVIPMLIETKTAGVTGPALSDGKFEFYKVKLECAKMDINVNSFRPEIPFAELKKDDKGLIPVIVQDYKTDEVLMLAYMNEQSFNQTIETGRMTYFSRSRNQLWIKGETSGHFQYLKDLSVDCDNDTLLAKVKQVGAACHTGNKSCFYRDIVKKDYVQTNPLKVFNDVMELINDRKSNPKNGSYTTYLFEQGIDKILKKCGEESTEIIIAAKNPDKEEIKYEVADYLYHLMVLMSLKGVTWEDIIRELANR